MKFSASSLDTPSFRAFGSGLDESLGLGQTQAGDLADSLDDLDLGSSVETGEDDVELGLLLGSGGSSRRQREQP